MSQWYDTLIWVDPPKSYLGPRCFKSMSVGGELPYTGRPVMQLHGRLLYALDPATGAKSHAGYTGKLLAWADAVTLRALVWKGELLHDPIVHLEGHARRLHAQHPGAIETLEAARRTEVLLAEVARRRHTLKATPDSADDLIDLATQLCLGTPERASGSPTRERLCQAAAALLLAAERLPPPAPRAAPTDLEPAHAS